MWDGAAALATCQTASDYASVCALDRGSDITALSARFGLPHHPSPGAPPDRQGVAAAWNALNGGRTGEPMTGPGIAAARSHLERHRSELGIGASAVEGITFDDPAVAASFRVNPDRRTISGLLVPWGAVSAEVAFARWRFAPGSLRWGDVTRIKLNTDHDHEQPVAYATRLQNTATGLDGTFKVARGAEGDRALSMAEDRVRDGFSVEVDFEDEDGWHVDPEDSGVNVVDRARLMAVAQTAFPAFDDARVARVAAMRKGSKMTDKDQELEGLELDQDAPAAAFERTMTAAADRMIEAQDRFMESVAASISTGIKVGLEEIKDEGPTPVSPGRRFEVTREAPVYRFNGTGHSLVRDAYYSLKEHDDEARDRLRKFALQTEDVAHVWHESAARLLFAPQTTGTASQVVPPGYRPDLYVSDLFRGRPYVQACRQATIPNATPFTVPVFGSITGGTADHVEGTNPSDGSLAFNTKTVTPQAISGRITLSRELVDSSNPAIDEIALAEMRESYARQTETKVYTLLNSTTGSGGTITTGFVPSGAQASTYVGSSGTPPALIAGIRKELARYPFNRFASPTAALMGQNATTILAQAADSTGRPIFPSIGATNSVGVGRSMDQAWIVDGLAFVPAWANTGTAAGDSQIHILDSADCYVWESPLLTFRFEEKQGPANIELNVFGYFGTHLLRPVGLSGIRIT